MGFNVNQDTMKPLLILIPAALAVFAAGFLAGREALPTAPEKGAINALNHVGLRVSDFEAAADFYEKKLGFKIAYRFDHPDGTPIFAYVQVSKDTFIELIPSDETHPAGFDHFGFETDRIDSLAAYFGQAGIKASKTSVSTFTGVHLSMAEDLDGIRFELIAPVEGSMLRKAIDGWEE